MTKKSQDKKLNIFRMKRAFEVKQKAFFVIFKGLSVAKYCLRHESAPLSMNVSPTEDSVTFKHLLISFS